MIDPQEAKMQTRRKFIQIVPVAGAALLAGREVLAQPGGIAIQILDAKIRDMGIYLHNYKNATTAKADTLEKLAEELGLPVANFVKTVHEYNAAVQPGN